MKKMIIEGGKKLTGTIEISGSKNSAVALVPASILSKGIVKIDGKDYFLEEIIVTFLGVYFSPKKPPFLRK